MTFVRGIARHTLLVLLTVNVAVGAAFAPEHVHERDEHHASATVHRHLAPHDVQRSHDPAHVEDDDGHVVWLTSAWLQSAVYHVPQMVTAPATVAVPAPDDDRWSALVLDEAAPPHGPPRAPRSPRAP